MNFEIGDKVVIGQTEFDEPDEREETRFEGEAGVVVDTHLVPTFENGLMRIYEVTLNNRVKHEACAGNTEVHSWPFYEDELKAAND